jgi:hypothetical protein
MNVITSIACRTSESASSLREFTAKERRDPACGIESYVEKRDTVCGPEVFFLARSEACGIELYNEVRSPLCDGYRAESTYKKDVHTTCGAKDYPRECNESDHEFAGRNIREEQCYARGALRVRLVGTITCKIPEIMNSCRRPEFGTELFKECRDSGHGVEQYKLCSKPEFGPKEYRSCNLIANLDEIKAFMAATNGARKPMLRVGQLTMGNIAGEFGFSQKLLCIMKTVQSDPEAAQTFQDLKTLHENKFGKIPDLSAINCSQLDAQDASFAEFRAKSAASCAGESQDGRCASLKELQAVENWFLVRIKETDQLLSDRVAQGDAGISEQLRALRSELTSAKLY